MRDAVSAWRKARELDPGYPNIDTLIAEASKRQQQRR
jgi:cytochrome c-type biogenesis protein CcmH/NrfG